VSILLVIVTIFQVVMVVMVAVAVAIAGLAKQKVHDDGRMMMNKLIFLQSNYGLHMTFQFDCPNKLVK